MRPSTYSSPGLGDKMNGQIEKILKSWSRQQKANAKLKSERDTSFSANKRKKQREEQ